MPILNPNNLSNLLKRPIALSNLFWLILVLILLAGNLFFGFRYSVAQQELKLVQATLETQKINEKILEFNKLFISEVLKADAEVSFETRLKLETAVRNLDDEEILNQWKKFIDSETEAEAQEEVKNLLEMLVSKIKV